MRLQMRCVDVHRSSGWARFDLESVGDGDLGPDCPRSTMRISTTNPARLEDFKLGETYELELAPTQAAVAPGSYSNQMDASLAPTYEKLAEAVAAIKNADPGPIVSDDGPPVHPAMVDGPFRKRSGR